MQTRKFEKELKMAAWWITNKWETIITTTDNNILNK
jgi:hypothetical protein